jgi:hypothetical protein
MTGKGGGAQGWKGPLSSGLGHHGKEGRRLRSHTLAAGAGCVAMEQAEFQWEKTLVVPARRPWVLVFIFRPVLLREQGGDRKWVHRGRLRRGGSGRRGAERGRATWPAGLGRSKRRWRWRLFAVRTLSLLSFPWDCLVPLVLVDGLFGGILGGNENLETHATLRRRDERWWIASSVASGPKFSSFLWNRLLNRWSHFHAWLACLEKDNFRELAFFASLLICTFPFRRESFLNGG